MASAPDSDAVSTLGVGDPRRNAVGRAVRATVLAAVAFFACAVPAKQLAPLYAHAPWRDDPYDTVYSFAMFFVPLACACLVVRVSLCRAGAPLAASRLRAVRRACGVALGAMAATEVSCWTAMALRADRAAWAAVPTGALIGGLAMVTGLSAVALARLLRVPSLRPGREVVSDLLSDVLCVARQQSRWAGPLRTLVMTGLSWSERQVAGRLRRHPLLWAAAGSLAFGTLVGANQAWREHYALAPSAVMIGLLACGMYAFLAATGSYLGLVRSDAPLRGPKRRGADAAVAACVVAIVVLALRNSLFWVVGTNPTAAGAGALTELLGLAAVGALLLTFSVESVLRLHAARG
jgi:hypothetical protein